MRRFIGLFLALLMLAPLTWAQQPQVKGLPIVTIVQLPSAGPASGTAFLVKDSSNGGCLVGGGTSYVICESVGGVWTARSSPGIISRTYTASTLTGTVARTAIASYSMPDGTLGLTREARVRVRGLYSNTGTAGVLTIYMVFGGQTWWADADTSATNTNTRAFALDFTIKNTTATNTQTNTGYISLSFHTAVPSPGPGQGVWAAGGNEQTGTFRGTSTVDTSAGGADIIQVDAQLPNTEGTCSLQIDSVTVELL